ncbi:hypothetical protein BKA70DRAFT_1220384 [Coprinopsis sp. MPI-PUGE-AT-0042]|nr:hypothetical protein BKA70DRAFT_1220384 [Coprinopsis sp. MPI-PUGE-AT-0042]
MSYYPPQQPPQMYQQGYYQQGPPQMYQQGHHQQGPPQREPPWACASGATAVACLVTVRAVPVKALAAYVKTAPVAVVDWPMWITTPQRFPSEALSNHQLNAACPFKHEKSTWKVNESYMMQSR